MLTVDVVGIRFTSFSMLSIENARLVLHMRTLGRAIPQGTFTTAKP